MSQLLMGVKVWSLTSDRKMCVQKLCRIVRVLILNKSTCVCVSVCVHLHLKKHQAEKTVYSYAVETICHM